MNRVQFLELLEFESTTASNFLRQLIKIKGEITDIINEMLDIDLVKHESDRGISPLPKVMRVEIVAAAQRKLLLQVPYAAV